MILIEISREGDFSWAVGVYLCGRGICISEVTELRVTRIARKSERETGRQWG